MSQVNLDALIPREDLEVSGTIGSTAVGSIFISHLSKNDFFLSSLRKPDFQRETCEWTPDRVYNLILSFTSGDLIPAIILWKGNGNTFVIDGAHRLSALISWVLNDYGDKAASLAFFGTSITEEQLEFAAQTRKLIESKIGSYQDILWASQNVEKADPDKIRIARLISSQPIYLQWVPGDAENAEKSFFKINEAAAPLDMTEKRLLSARNKPPAIAARAIIRAGSGHKYWAKFSDHNQQTVEQMAKDIHEWLFLPKLDSPLKTFDIPIAGKSYAGQTMELILNVVNYANGMKLVDASRMKKPEDFPEYHLDDERGHGDQTIEFLTKAKRLLSNIVGKQSSSLGLHPAIYFYSHQGRYQITAFLAILHLIDDYEERRQLKKFTKIRRAFEEFLWTHKSLVNQATTKWGSGAKGYLNLSKLFDYVIKKLIDGLTSEDIIKDMDVHEIYNFYKPNVRELNPKHVKKFSTDSKSEVFLKAALHGILRCGICGGYLHINSMQIDHKVAIEDGGVGNSDNGQMTHPYCNSIKKKLVLEGFIEA